MNTEPTALPGGPPMVKVGTFMPGRTKLDPKTTISSNRVDRKRNSVNLMHMAQTTYK